MAENMKIYILVFNYTATHNKQTVLTCLSAKSHFNCVLFGSIDWEGIRNLVEALPPSLQRIVLVSSVGVTKFNELPWRYS